MAVRIVAIITLGILGILLVGSDGPAAWWQPLRQLKAWHLNQKGSTRLPGK